MKSDSLFTKIFDLGSDATYRSLNPNSGHVDQKKFNTLKRRHLKDVNNMREEFDEIYSLSIRRGTDSRTVWDWITKGIE